MTYKRTSGYRNWMNKRGYVPVMTGNVAKMASGTKYLITDKGWVRVNAGGGL